MVVETTDFYEPYGFAVAPFAHFYKLPLASHIDLP